MAAINKKNNDVKYQEAEEKFPLCIREEISYIENLRLYGKLLDNKKLAVRS